VTIPPPRLIQRASDWHSAAAILRDTDRLAVDVEGDGFHRYPERVALIQIALADGTIWVVDPLAIHDLSALGAALADRDVQVVMHSASYDVRSLDRDYGFQVADLFDTAIAAQFIGERQTGLANVLDHCQGVVLVKAKEQQRRDWSQRPLSAEALAYAAGDVRHLLCLADALVARLTELGRLAWVVEECRRLAAERYSPPPPPAEACLGVRGARDLTDAGRAVLRALYVFREAEARRTGRPPYRLMGDAALLALAAQPSVDPARLVGVNRRWLSAVRTNLRQAVRSGQAATPLPWPRRGQRSEWTRPAEARLRSLKTWRQGEAERLGLDPGILWPVDHLAQIALHPAARSVDLDQGNPPWVRSWQWAELGPALDRHRRRVLGDGGSGAGRADD